MLTVKGRINEHGELEAELPVGIEPGDVTVTIEYEAAERALNDPDAWTDEELAELMKPGQPLTGAEIVKLLDEMRPTGWEHVKDGAEWVIEQREKRKQRWK